MKGGGGGSSLAVVKMEITNRISVVPVVVIIRCAVINVCFLLTSDP